MRVQIALSGRLGATLLLVVSLLACTGQPIPLQAVRGGTATLALNDGADTTDVGFTSTIAGSDVQRGKMIFVLCPVGSPNCDRSGGEELETVYATRIGPSPSAIASNLGAVAVVLNVPFDAAPGVRVLRGFQIDPDGTQRPLFPEDRPRSLEILDIDGTPTVLADPEEPSQAQILQQSVPRSAVVLRQTQPFGVPGVQAASIRFRYPSDKVEIVDVVPAAQSNLPTVLEFGPRGTGEIEVLMTADAGIVSPAVVFELKDAAVAPVPVSEFEILEQRVYDSQGIVREEEPFSIEGIL